MFFMTKGSIQNYPLLLKKMFIKMYCVLTHDLFGRHLYSCTLMQSPSICIATSGSCMALCNPAFCMLSERTEGSKDASNTWCMNVRFHRSTVLTGVSYERRTRPSWGTLCPQPAHGSVLETASGYLNSLLLEDRHRQWQWWEQSKRVCLWSHREGCECQLSWYQGTVDLSLSPDQPSALFSWPAVI